MAKHPKCKFCGGQHKPETNIFGGPLPCDACLDHLRARVKVLGTAGERVAVALTLACKELGEKNPRKTVPVLAAWDKARKAVNDG